MPQVVVGLDLYLKRTHGTVMTLDGRVVRQERFSTTREDLKRFLAGLPRGTEVGLESLGFCWPWIDLIEELGHKPLLGDPIKLKHRAEDAKTDRIDSEFIATLLRMRWFPAVYVPNKELRQLRSLLGHRVFRRRISTALKNRTWSEFRKRDIQLDVNLGTKRGRSIASSTRIYEVAQNLKLLEVVEAQMKQIEAKLEKRYGELEPIRLLQTIPGIGFITALTLYAEICDIKRFSTPDKLAHYAGLFRACGSLEGTRDMEERPRATDGSSGCLSRRLGPTSTDA